MTRLTLCAVLFGMLTTATIAQEAPSWRSETDRPSRLQQPPAMERAEIDFEIDRGALFGQPMGFTATQNRPTEAVPEAIEPSLRPADFALPEPARPVPQSISIATSADVADVANPADGLLSQPVTEPAIDSKTGAAPDSDWVQPSAVESLQAKSTLAAVTRPEVLPTLPAPPLADAVVANQADYQLKTRRTVNPVYPNYAVRRAIEGWVDMSLTVSPNGRVTDVTILESQPASVFDSAATKAAMRWRFDAPAEAGISQPQVGRYRLTFVLED